MTGEEVKWRADSGARGASPYKRWSGRCTRRIVGVMEDSVGKLVEMVESMGIKAVYGDRVTVGGVEVLPVAIVYFGFGAGSDEKEGSGGGGGGASIPVGAYISGPSGPAFRPNLVILLGVGIPFTVVFGRALARIIRALKR